MPVVSDSIHVKTDGKAEVVDLTPNVSEALKTSKLKRGIVTVSVIGSTGAITTIEYEPGLIKDIPEIFEKLIPEGHYHHDATWGDGNGHSHLRSSLVGPSVTIPFQDKELVLGTWQQIVLIDFDNRSREREIFLQFVGE